MNNQFRKNFWKIIVSLMTLGLFILLSVGSFDSYINTLYLRNYKKTYDTEEGLYRVEEDFGFGRKKTTWGVQNKGKWHGGVKIRIDEPNGDSVIIITNMYNGKRHGINVTTLPDGTTITHCYKMGNLVDCSYFFTESRMAESQTSFQYLSSRYPWLIIMYNAFGFDDDYIEAFLDTVETIIAENPVDISQIEDYYDDAVETLEETPYDSIIRINTASSFLEGCEELKNYPLRLAVADHYIEGNPTFQIIQSRYSHYPEPLYDEGGTETEFEQFCNDLDDTLALFGPLDPEDPFFYDSVDSWLNWAILDIYSALEEETEVVQGNRNMDMLLLFRQKMQNIRPFSIKYSSPEIAEMVLYEIVMTWYNGDICRNSVIQTYMANNGAYVIPVITTTFIDHFTSTAAVIEGHVIEDGGAEVTSRGVAWGTGYNPDIEDNIVDGGAGTGDFEVNITDLTEGTTYYARAYATNSEGTAYGNCIEFTASEVNGTQSYLVSDQYFNLFPNPASTQTTVNFRMDYPENARLMLIDMNGRQIVQKDLGRLSVGVHQVTFDLSDIPEGIYCIELLYGNSTSVQKVVISR